MTQAAKKAPVMTMAMVITGNMLGAGILALPIKTGLSGFWPSLAGIILMWLCMLGTALILASQKSFAQSATADLPTFFQEQLGTAGKWITVAANLLILYGLITAYISGAASVIESLFKTPIPDAVPMIAFFIVAATLTLFGMGVLRKGNAVIMLLMWASFLALIFLTGDRVKPARLSYTDWAYLPAALPIVVTAFHFHNIIPSICRTMDFDFKAIRKAMFIGTAVGMVMNAAWALVVIGALPMAGNQGTPNIFAAFQANLPATVPLQRIMHTTWFTDTALLFALLAITAAFMANGTALKSFIRDLTSTYLGTQNGALVFILAFAPPLAIAVIYPAIFISAIDLVGGLGIGLIFGVLPAVLLIKQKTGLLRKCGWALLAVFGFVLVLELLQECGLLHIQPHVEYWLHGVGKAHLP